MSDEGTRYRWTRAGMTIDAEGHFVTDADHRRIVEGLEARVKELVDVIIDAKMERLLTHLGIRKP